MKSLNIPSGLFKNVTRYEAASISKAWLYGLVLLVNGCILLIALALNAVIGRQEPFLFFTFGIIISSWIGGIGPGLFATAFGAFALLYFFLPPYATLIPIDWRVVLQESLFIGSGLLINTVLHLQKIGEKRNWEKANQLQVTLSSIGDAVITADIKGRITFINPIAERLTGWRQKDAYGKKFTEVFHVINGKTHELREGSIEEIMRGKRVIDLAHDVLLVAKAGTRIPIEDSSAPIRNKEGVVIGIVIVFRDAVERKKKELEKAQLLTREQKAHQKAKEATQRFRELQTIAEVALAHLDLDELFHEFLMRIRKILKGDSAVVLLLENNQTSLAMRASHGFKQKLSDEVKIPLKEGITGRIAESQKPMVINDLSKEPQSFFPESVKSLLGAPLLCEGKFIGVIYVGTITEHAFSGKDMQLLQLVADRMAVAIDRSRLYQAEREARAQAQEAARARDEFLSIASHELKTPLTSMLLHLQSVLNNIRNQSLADFSIEKTMNMLESTQQQSKRLARLINDLLNVSLITTGRLELEEEQVDLAIITKDVVGRFAQRAEKAGSAVALKADTSIVGHWDKFRIEQVLANLLSNALKYGLGKPIHITLEKKDSQAVLHVQDFGIGIPKDQLAKVFDRFKRIVSPREYRGLGIGLYICSQIVKAHHGKISVVSVPKKGSTFTIELPLKK